MYVQKGKVHLGPNGLWVRGQWQWCYGSNMSNIITIIIITEQQPSLTTHPSSTIYLALGHRPSCCETVRLPGLPSATGNSTHPFHLLYTSVQNILGYVAPPFHIYILSIEQERTTAEAYNFILNAYVYTHMQSFGKAVA